MAAIEDPDSRFGDWIAEAREKLPTGADTAAFATVDEATQRPSVRPLRLVDFHDGRLLFLSNRGSRKVRELLTKPQMALYFWWPTLNRCARIEGCASISDSKETVLKIFKKIPSQTQRALMAAGETQSQIGVDTTAARTRMKDVAAIADDQLVPPDTLCLISVRPDYYEFYESDSHLLADRTVFRRNEGAEGWEKSCLGP